MIIGSGWIHLKARCLTYIDSGFRDPVGTPGGLYSGYEVKNETVFMNRFGLHMKANPVEDVTMKAKLGYVQGIRSPDL